MNDDEIYKLKKTHRRRCYILWKTGEEKTIVRPMIYIGPSTTTHGHIIVSTTYGAWFWLDPQQVYFTKEEAEDAIKRGIEGY